MKNSFFLFKLLSIVTISFIFFTSCNKNNDIEEVAGNEKAVLLDMGFNESDIQEHDDYFIVEEDMVFRKENLKPKSNEQEPTFIPKQLESSETPNINTIPVNIPVLPIEMRQRRSDNWVVGYITDNVRIQIHSSIDDWSNSIQQAINAWNNSGAKINIDIVTSFPDITIYSDASSSCPSSHRNLASNTCGRGDFPANGLPGEVISINMDNPLIDTNAKRLRTITHEIGHNLGLAHTNTSFGVHIGGTATTDSNSLMNSGECGTTKTLSTNDIIAIKTLYPECGESAEEWFYNNNFGWLYYEGDNWYYMESKDIWVFIDTYENLCNSDIWFYTFDSICGEFGWLYTDLYGWAYSSQNEYWFYWPSC